MNERGMVDHSVLFVHCFNYVYHAFIKTKDNHKYVHSGIHETRSSGRTSTTTTTTTTNTLI